MSRAAVLVCALVACLGFEMAPVAAAAPPWGACGRSTAVDKVVRIFPSPQGPLTLRCGGPLRSSEPTWGYRHIAWKHSLEFDSAARGTLQNWRDTADLAAETIAADPDVMLPAGGNQTCRSRVLFLNNLQTKQLVRQQIFVVYTRNGSNEINSVFPRNHPCRG